jgi:primosomal protein N'
MHIVRGDSSGSRINNENTYILLVCMCVCDYMDDKPKCPKCDSGNIYFRKDKTMTCRRCGYDSSENDNCGDVISA